MVIVTAMVTTGLMLMVVMAFSIIGTSSASYHIFILYLPASSSVVVLNMGMFVLMTFEEWLF